MNHSKKLSASIVTLSLAVAYGQAFAGQPAGQAGLMEGASTTLVESPCEQLSWQVANKLPSWIRARDVACMSPTLEDLQASEQARVLLVTAARRMRDQNTIPDSQAESEYDDGIAAYAEGRYADAIAHFQAAMPSASRVQYEN